MKPCCSKVKDNSVNNYQDYLTNVKLLRDEATSLKECFNNQCFQVIAIVSTFYVFLFRFMVNGGSKINFDICLSAYVVLIIIISVLNVGIYKFESANRLIGFILHVERRKHIDYSRIDEKSFIVNWESMVKAWRVFQTIIENEMYVKWSNNHIINLKESFCKEYIGDIFKIPLEFIYCQVFKGKLKSRYRNKDKYLWYLPGELVHSKGEYSPGNYLKRMMYMLHVLGLIAIFLIALGTYQGKLIAEYRIWFIILFWVTIPLLAVFMFYRPMILSKRIEQQLFCIHSTAIFWGVIYEAHNRALDVTVTEGKKPLKHYTFILSCIALHFVDYGIDRVHEWCGGDPEINIKISKYIQENLLDDYPVELRPELIRGLRNLENQFDTEQSH